MNVRSDRIPSVVLAVFWHAHLRDGICEYRPSAQELDVGRQMVTLWRREPGDVLPSRIWPDRIEYTELHSFDVGSLGRGRGRLQLVHRYFYINGADFVRPSVLCETRHRVQFGQVRRRHRRTCLDDHRSLVPSSVAESYRREVYLRRHCVLCRSSQDGLRFDVCYGCVHSPRG
jgi:hypothetical protein